MTDIYDQATFIEERDRELSIAHVRAQNQPIKFSGRCLSCNAQIESGRYCDSWCREDHEQELRIRIICGKR